MTPEPAPASPASLEAERILVMAPHPDDESLGCGGLVASLVRLGRRFHFVFVTDGGSSHRRSASWPRPRLAARREEEAAEALARLGAGGEARTFLRLPDAAMPAAHSEERHAALLALADIVGDFRPDLVLLPWRRDPHCDHRDTWSLTQDALAVNAATPTILEYAIWLDEIGAGDDRPRDGEVQRIVFDIAPVAAVKRFAVAAHLSQTTDLIADDPEAFRLTQATIDRLTGPLETYWRSPS